MKKIREEESELTGEMVAGEKDDGETTNISSSSGLWRRSEGEVFPRV